MNKALKFTFLLAAVSLWLGVQPIRINSSAILSWNSASGASSYNVKRGTVSGGPYATIKVNVACCRYTDNKVAPGTYYYVVSAVGGSEGPNSSQVQAIIP